MLPVAADWLRFDNMIIRRHFLDESTPPLHQAVSYLIEQHPPARPWDLHNLIIAVPGRRAVRRLTELLVEASGPAGLLPPSIVTVGQLPEQLYEPETPITSDLVANLTWIEAARSTAEFDTLVPHPPEPADLASWWSLANQFRGITSDLAAADLLASEVPQHCADRGVVLPQTERWEALAAVDRCHTTFLARCGFVEADSARRAAIQREAIRAGGELILVGVTDMSPVVARFVRSLDVDVTALIHAPESAADSFDDLGTIVTDRWFEHPVEFDNHYLHVVDHPFDQGRQAAVVIDARSHPEGQGEQPDLTIDDITVGLGDESAVDGIRRPLELAGLPTRYAAGQPMSSAPPVLFLKALAELADRRRFSDLAGLLRHPDVESWLQTTGDTTDWLSILDDYRAEHLQDRISGDWMGRSSHAKRLDCLWRRVDTLLPDQSSEVQPLPDWSEPILISLRAIYGSITFEREADASQSTLRALQRIATLLGEHRKLDASHSLPPHVTFAGAVDLVLQRLTNERIPEEASTPAVEMLGFLELPLDDTPELIITGMNEGKVPAVRGPDPLLPDHLCQVLGLDDNRRRYARAAYALFAILRSRPAVTLIAGRWSSDGEPLAPSRLLLACDDSARVRRLRRFYQAGETESPPASKAPLLLVPGDSSGFFPPPPPTDDDTPLPDRLSVTAFREYIACPYRFYLRRVLGLRGPIEPGNEMDGALFGNLVHDVLQAFGESSVAASQNPGNIEDFLLQTLQETATARFGDRPAPAISVQLDQLRLRLHHFALVQAEIAADGWQIHGVELNQNIFLDVDGEGFTISGRVDRIDVHDERGTRIIYYKSGDTPRTPEQTHRRAHSEWLDLQLPLYRELVRPIELDGPIQLAYFNLPRRQEELKLAVADWSENEIDGAVEFAREIVRQIRGRVFWPPGDPAQYEDEFSRLCADHALNRSELIKIGSRHRAAAG